MNNSLDFRPYSIRSGSMQPTPIRSSQSAVQSSSFKVVPMTPDNGIKFLNNNTIIKNPMPMKTPPPPLWGTIIEEQLYDKNQPFYSGSKVADAEAMKRLDSQSNYKVTTKIVFTAEPTKGSSVQAVGRQIVAKYKVPQLPPILMPAMPQKNFSSQPIKLTHRPSQKPQMKIAIRTGAFN